MCSTYIFTYFAISYHNELHFGFHLLNRDCHREKLGMDKAVEGKDIRKSMKQIKTNL